MFCQNQVSAIIILTMLLGNSLYHRCFSQIIEIDSVTKVNLINYNVNFKNYNDLSKYKLHNADPTLLSFFGEYDIIFDSYLSHNINLSDKKNEIKEKAEFIKNVNNPKVIKSYSKFLEKSLDILTKIENLKKNNLHNAKNLIIQKSVFYNFILINEAHYSGQHRAFSASLLQGLWNNGYRYLAVEALGYDDKDINQRNFPIYESGYYIKEVGYGNFIREAKKIGFQLISYETKKEIHGTERDLDQAHNIYNETIKIDPKAKVLVHAGYSHINEEGDSNYLPLGYHLKKLLKEDILTVDQQTMSQQANSEDNSYLYIYINNKFDLDYPIVPLDNNLLPIVDFVHHRGVDIQVYHPIHTFIDKRPMWMLENNYIISLPSIFRNYKNCLLEIRNKDEPFNSVPIDSFVFSDNKKSIIVTIGNYYINIVDENGVLIAIVHFKVIAD